MNIILKAYHGSKLYGTDSESSDLDIKGIYLPTHTDVILQNVPKQIDLSTNKSSDKNISSDIDEEYYSLHYFLKLAQKGETVALDMLHIPPSKNIIGNNEGIWEFIYNNRSKFYTKNTKALLGYCKTQANKYGIKGSRLNTAKDVINFLKTKESYQKLHEIWDELWEDEHCTKIKILDCREQDNRAWEVCGKKLMANTPIEYGIKTIQHFYNSYGARAKMAANNEGIDWKAISHAFRAGYQLKEIYQTGDLKFPLKDAQVLKDIKYGKYHYKNDFIGQKLEDLIVEIDELANKSCLPEKVDMKFWNRWVVKLYE